MADYTRKEVAAISDAYRALAYLAECSSWANPQRLRDALRHEARGRGQSVAKALMVREALRAVMAARGVDVQYSPAVLWSLSPGLATAYLFGGWCAIQEGRLRKLTDAFVTSAEHAGVAHDDAQVRAFDALERGEGC